MNREPETENRKPETVSRSRLLLSKNRERETVSNLVLLFTVSGLRFTPSWFMLFRFANVLVYSELFAVESTLHKGYRSIELS